MTADELRAISRKLSTYVELRPMTKMLDQWQIDVERPLHCLKRHQPISACEREVPRAPAVLKTEYFA